jgi:MarR-like DNA-binding transcriptional regulator SgrR of sgrS sRNA
MPLIAFLLLAAASLPAQRPRYGGAITIETHAAMTAPARMPARFAALVFEGLVELDASGIPRPALASSWSHDPAQRRWQFQLARAAAHDGSPVTAQAVAAALGAQLPGRTVSAAGDGLVVQSKEPSPRLLYELAHPRNALVFSGADGVTRGTGPFRIVEWTPGKRVLLGAFEEHRGGRPYLDAVEILFSRPHADQLRDLELGRAQVVDLLPADARRRQQRGGRIWLSPPHQLLALVWKRDRPAAQSPALREALALSIDRTPMVNVLLQRQGEATGALLPQWLTGYAFLFPWSRDLARARQMSGTQAAPLSLDYDGADPAMRPLADRIALNAGDADIAVRVVSSGAVDLTLVRIDLALNDAGAALEEAARAMGAAPGLSGSSLEAIYEAERRLLADRWIIPLFHAPEILGLAPQLKDLAPHGALRWPTEEAWLEP